MLRQTLPVLILLLFTLNFTAVAQKSEQLKDERNSVKAEIEKTATEIKSTAKQKKTTYQQFLDLKKNESSKQEMVKTLESEIEQIDGRIERQNDVVNSLAADLGLMKATYAELLRKAYREQQSNQKFLFLFSALDFNDFVRRWHFCNNIIILKSDKLI
ncbi:MAG: hypothetical protein HC803_01190 [Saprospiraceae bacterium]|nr:hypothetical protein [Saprospiraceae bacterium]